MGLIPYGLSPDETWALDFAAARARREIALLRGAAKAAREAVAQARVSVQDGEAAPKIPTGERLDAAAADVEKELAAYQPRTGPVFVVGPIPNALRAEIAGEHEEVMRLPEGAERQRRLMEWSEKVIRWSIRGHTNLRSRSGEQVPFDAEDLTGPDGRARKGPSRRTLEAYQPIVHDLALAALASQRMDEVEKNG